MKRVAGWLGVVLVGTSWMGVARAEHPPPFTVEEGLLGATPQQHPRLERPVGAETITIFAPSDDTDKFSNGVQVYPFKGYLYAQWQSTPQHEDTKDSRVVWSRSPNGVDWEPPRELAAQPEQGGFMRSGAGFHSDGETLVAYIQRVDSWYPGRVKITEARTTTDGVNWSALRIVTGDGAMAENVRPLPSGRLLTTVQGHLPDSSRMYGLVAYSDQADGLGGWRIAEMPQPESNHRSYGRGIEPSWFARADGRPVIVFRDMNRSGRLLAALGEVGGERFGEMVEVDYPDSNSMQCAGNLPDGTAYVVNNPVSNSRQTLGIALSRDGKHFDRAYALRGPGDRQPLRYEGRHKTLGYSYPGAVVWGDHLYVAYATNKEDAEITRIPLSSLMMNREP